VHLLVTVLMTFIPYLELGRHYARLFHVSRPIPIKSDTGGVQESFMGSCRVSLKLGQGNLCFCYGIEFNNIYASTVNQFAILK